MDRMSTDLPAPVVPATSMWGDSSKLTASSLLPAAWLNDRPSAIVCGDSCPICPASQRSGLGLGCGTWSASGA